MIPVTRLDGTHLLVNSDQIEFVEATPDTVISLISDQKIIVREPPEEIINLVVAFRRRLLVPPPILFRDEA
jgi:flagellar protein FlbD